MGPSTPTTEDSMKRVCLLSVLLAVLAPVGNATAEPPLPYDTDTGTEVGLLAAGAAVWSFGYWLDRQDPRNRALIPEEVHALDARRLPDFDRGATRNWSPTAAALSDRFLSAGLLAPVLLDLSSVGREEPLALTTMHLECLLLNGGVTYLLKSRVRRVRPFVYNGNPAIPASLKLSRSARRSFPSGHTSTTFASLVFMATVYGKMYPDDGSRHWVWAGCLAAAGTTGYLRYRAGYHFPSDILAGAALGGFVGWLVPRMHEIDPVTPSPGARPRPVLVGITLGF
ncbi:phosphoesterase PA-phosphatase [bacterium DOLZORAL124_64_63]|nr:MAG: phosphoesterase PA-phosphatase [bacterium DOLZORAL124_64_63]